MTWIVAVSHPQREFRALKSLQDHGFWAWLPTRIVTRRPRQLKGREISRSYPLFGGGYVFVWEAPLVALGSRAPITRDLYGVDDVRGTVCMEGRPLRIADDVMDALRHRIDNPVPILEDILTIGDKVYVTDGPFFTFRGTVERDDGKGALSVLLDLFGRKTPVEMSVEQLRRAA